MRANNKIAGDSLRSFVVRSREAKPSAGTMSAWASWHKPPPAEGKATAALTGKQTEFAVHDSPASKQYSRSMNATAAGLCNDASSRSGRHAPSITEGSNGIYPPLAVIVPTGDTCSCAPRRPDLAPAVRCADGCVSARRSIASCCSAASANRCESEQYWASFRRRKSEIGLLQ